MICRYVIISYTDTKLHCSRKGLISPATICADTLGLYTMHADVQIFVQKVSKVHTAKPQQVVQQVQIKIKDLQ